MSVIAPEILLPDFNGLEHTYPYQVSGHGALLRLPNGKVCKPLIERELAFYEEIQTNIRFSPLLPFIPRYFGQIEINFSRDQLQVWVDSIQRAEEGIFPYSDLCSNTEDNKSNNNVQELRNPSNSLDIVHNNKQPFRIEQVYINPWCLRVSKRNLNQLLSKGIALFKNTYIVLEDLSTKYEHPCICDIKLGTRQHGDDAAPDKRIRHMRKCATTTSSTLGIRLCGQLIYIPLAQSYRHFDKYEGRKLTAETIKPAIAQFFSNGKEFRRELLPQFLRQLKQLAIVLKESCNNCRFYSTSLLLLYEGSTRDNAAHKVDMRMIDFAHTFPLRNGEENDDGYLFGLSNLIRILQELYRESGNDLESI